LIRTGKGPLRVHTRLTVRLATVAVFLLVPAAGASAAGTLTVDIEGGGSGEVSSVGGFGGLGVYEGEPPIECTYESPGPAEGVCENEMSEDPEEGFSLVALHATPAPGSEFVEWKLQKVFRASAALTLKAKTSSARA
jgi:hypothetical protein